MRKIYLTFILACTIAHAFAAGHVVTLNATPTSCTGACDGTINSSVSGGVGPFAYSWSPGGGSSSSMTGCAGTYVLTVTDLSDASTASATATITAGASLSVTLSSLGPVCGTACDGYLMCNITSGATYSWNGPSGPFTAGASASSLCAGTYTVNVTTSAGCTGTATQTITSVPVPVISFGSGSTTICAGTCTTLAPTVSGGTPAYTFLWSPASAVSSSTSASPTVCPTSSTTFTCVVSDANGCVAYGSMVANVDLITLSTTSTASNDCSACDGAATVSPTGGSAPYAYSWSNGSTAPTVSSLCPANYSVTVWDNMGCNASDTVTILTIPAVHTSFTMVPDSANPYSFWAFNSSSGTALYSLWDFGDGSTANVPNPMHTYVGPGTYNVCLSSVSFVCGSDTVCQNVTAGLPPTCLALFNIGDDTVSSNPDDHYVYNLSYGSSLTYFWDFGDGSTSTLMTPSHIYSGAGPYNLCLTVDNGAGCTQTYCETLNAADSLNRSGVISIVTYDVPAPGSITTDLSNNELARISVYPQPARDEVTVELPASISRTGLSFQVYDVLGKKIREVALGDSHVSAISLRDLSPGAYVYKIASEGKVFRVDRLIKQ